MKTISEHLADRRHEKARRAAATIAALSMAVLIACVTAAAVVKTARIVAADQARCAEVCEAPAW